MEHDVLRYTESAVSPLGRQGEVDPGRQDVRQAMEGQRRLMREHPLALGPEPHHGQLLVIACGKMDQAVHAMPDPRDATSSDVLQQQLRRISRFSPLLRREVAVLSARRLVEAVPSRLLSWGWHAQTVTSGLVLCNRVFRTKRTTGFSFVRSPLSVGGGTYAAREAAVDDGASLG